ncbi:MAG: phosphoheptose isomerase [Burkholderiales bacterium]|jgi:BMFP domain-containing protein YqiC|nr:phosphoheptose isomerase [Burkholderiales bacterium]MCE3268138.1 phosphoheptose isomerase [Burkholderiales bacterium]
MIKSNILDQVNEQVSKAISNSPFTDVEKNLKSIVIAILNKLDIVTREEFDTQQKVLAATREKLEKLEQQLEKFKQQA